VLNTSICWAWPVSPARCFLTTLALIEGNHRGWTDRWIVEELTSALALFGLFIAVERKQARPMLDLSYFRKPTYLGANVAQLSFSAGMLTMLTFIPIFLQSGLGHPSAIAGLMMLPMVLPLFVVPRIVGEPSRPSFVGTSTVDPWPLPCLSRPFLVGGGGQGPLLWSDDWRHAADRHWRRFP